MYGGGELSSMISLRFGLRATGEGALLGIDRVKGRAEEESLMMASSSSSTVLMEGDDAVEGVRDDMECAPSLRECMTLLHNCLHTRRASWSDRSSAFAQGQ